MHPTVGDGGAGRAVPQFPPAAAAAPLPPSPQHGAAWAGSPGARWSSATAQRHGGGWLWGGRSPFQPRAQTENKLHSRYKEQPPKHPRDSGELGTGGQGQRALLRPLLGIWGTGLGVPLGAGSGEAEARVGPALFQQKNLQCVRGAGSVTTAMPRGPGASPCHPCRAEGGRRGAQGAAGAPRARGARVGLWLGLLVTDLPREGKDGEAGQLRAFSRLPRRWQDRGLVPEEPEVPKPTRGEDAALEPAAAVPAPALLGAAVPGERHAHHGEHAGHRWVSVELGGVSVPAKLPGTESPTALPGGCPCCAPQGRTGPASLGDPRTVHPGLHNHGGSPDTTQPGWEWGWCWETGPGCPRESPAEPCPKGHSRSPARTPRTLFPEVGSGPRWHPHGSLGCAATSWPGAAPAEGAGTEEQEDVAGPRCGREEVGAGPCACPENFPRNAAGYMAPRVHVVVTSPRR